MKKLLTLIFIFFLFYLSSWELSAQESKVKTWKAGVASVIITPKEPMWMAGFASRVHPSEGKLHDLWAKALVIEDADGKKGVLITADLAEIPKGLSDPIRDRLEKEYQLSRSQIIINSSHTHSGPVLQSGYTDLYPLDDHQKELVRNYSLKFEDQVVALVEKALGSMKPVNISSQNGITRFAVNRRNNIEANINAQTDLNGPSDYSVPVIRVSDKKGKIIAIAFGYACHNTVLNGYEWSGDYAGYAQIQIEKAHPGATALFFQGCGGNQNALPRRTVPLAKQYGQELALAVGAAMETDMKELEPKLSTAYSEVNIELEDAPSRTELNDIASKENGYIKNWALNMIKKADNGEKFIKSYPYPVQFWKMGNQQLVTLGGEPMVDYAINLKKVFGSDLFVMGYSNDVMAYIPTLAILREGGYEGHTSQMAAGMPAKWKESIEPTIMGEIIKLAKELGIKVPESK